MNNFFGQIYEVGDFYHNVYSPELYSIDFYTNFGLLMLLVPTALMSLFYFANKHPYGKWWHWLIVWLVSGATVLLVSSNMLNENLAMYVLDEENYPDVNDFVLYLALLNMGYSLLVGFVISKVFQQFPLPQSTLPFCLKKKK